ncbi:MAG TPA: F0F1 ATP synthase subunit B [Planctomycetota bacterium]|nr:F0F1 ATP synthase subunit B [Planctomycetota bacterium]
MRRIPWMLVALACAVALAPSCLAADGHGEEQPGLLSVNLVVAVTTIVTFLLLLVVLAKTAWKPILQGLQAREKGIRDQIEGAEKANAEARTLLSEYERRLAHATDEARSIVEEGRRDAQAVRGKIEAEARLAATEERDRAVRDIDLARQKALKDIYDEVAKVATDVAGQIIQREVRPEDHKKLVEQGLSQLESRRPPTGGRA